MFHRVGGKVLLFREMNTSYFKNYAIWFEYNCNYELGVPILRLHPYCRSARHR